MTAHYNPYADVIIGKRKKLQPKGKAPVKGENPVSTKPAKYLGSVITPQNRNIFAAAQSEYFKERYLLEMKTDKEAAILAGDDAKVKKIDEEMFNEEVLQEVSDRFGRYQCNKEQKHYAAWQKGLKFYKFHDNRFPVLTEDMVNKDLIEIERLALAEETVEEISEDVSDSVN